MTAGDRVVVIADGDEWTARAGVMNSVRADGFVGVVMDGTDWEVFFWPHDLELESIVRAGKVPTD